MATPNTSTTTELCSIADRLHEIAAQLAGIKPIAETLCDQSSPDVGSAINLIGAVSGYINHALCDIASRLDVLGRMEVGTA